MIEMVFIFEVWIPNSQAPFSFIPSPWTRLLRDVNSSKPCEYTKQCGHVQISMANNRAQRQQSRLSSSPESLSAKLLPSNIETHAAVHLRVRIHQQTTCPKLSVEKKWATRAGTPMTLNCAFVECDLQAVPKAIVGMQLILRTQLNWIKQWKRFFGPRLVDAHGDMKRESCVDQLTWMAFPTLCLTICTKSSPYPPEGSSVHKKQFQFQITFAKPLKSINIIYIGHFILFGTDHSFIPHSNNVAIIRNINLTSFEKETNL